MESSVGAQYIALARQEDNTMNYCMLYQITPSRCGRKILGSTIRCYFDLSTVMSIGAVILFRRARASAFLFRRGGL